MEAKGRRARGSAPEKQLEAAVRAERVHVKELRCNERLDERRQSDETVERMKSLIAEEKRKHMAGRSRTLIRLRCRAPMRRKPTRRKCSASGNSPVYERLGEAVEREQQAKQAYESAKQYYERAVREGASRLLAEKNRQLYWRKKYVSAAKAWGGHPPGPRRRLRNMSACTSFF